ncbi:DUF4407 domain-containing protein [Sphingobacterium sp. Mn56C]|uniref:DUF4407 domain-containing protein n=1 Tax=Sphingobacterium sp. Mn56C TaxID=3395261 RepID=UPI003BE0D3C1
MKDWWLKFGCWLTGFNYKLVKHSSEISSKNVKKYTSALLLIMLVWVFIGYTFAMRYLHTGIFGGVVAALICAFVILQIERIIILSSKLSKVSTAFRVVLAVIMALIGSFIMDQIIFKEDIELKKVQLMDERVKDAVKNSEADLRNQIASYDSTLLNLNQKASFISSELQKNPVIVTSYTNTSVTRDREGNNVNTTNSTNKSILENPKKFELEQTLKQIEALTNKKFEVEASIGPLKKQKEEELRKTSGFIDEIEILHSVITTSNLALFIYLLFLFFFLSIELFVVSLKLWDSESDYDKLIRHQTEVRLKMLEKLSP